ncbi:MAG: glycosyltransferase family 2 protein [Bdellovibrionota bacterium]
MTVDSFEYYREMMWAFAGLSLALFLMMFRYHVLLALISQASKRYRILKRPKILNNHPRFVILVPAHNEDVGIAATIGSIHALDYPKNAYRLMVIADNCTDQTATTARACGAEVLERFHDELKSKGYALEYAIAHLQTEAVRPDAIVVIDADTRVDRQLLNVFAHRFQEGQDFIQAYYSVSNPDDSWRTQLMTFAFALFNGIWLAGQDQLGLGCSLRGNGMCFSWRGLRRQPWRAYGLAEDLEYSWYLRTAGETIHFASDARVYGEIISGNAKASKNQRLRWEKGRAELKTTFARAILAVKVSKFRKWILKSDLNMIPLSRYVFGSVLGFLSALIGLIIAVSTGVGSAVALSILLLLAYTGTLGYLGLYLSLPFTRLGLPLRYLFALTRAPLYAAWKLKILFSRTPVQWVRTERMADQKRD